MLNNKEIYTQLSLFKYKNNRQPKYLVINTEYEDEISSIRESLKSDFPQIPDIEIITSGRVDKRKFEIS